MYVASRYQSAIFATIGDIFISLNLQLNQVR